MGNFIRWERLTPRQRELVTQFRSDIPKRNLPNMEFRFETRPTVTAGVRETFRVGARHTKEVVARAQAVMNDILPPPPKPPYPEAGVTSMPVPFSITTD